MLRDAAPDDAHELARIYNPYVLDTPVTFEEDAVTAAQMRERLAETRQAGLPWLVLEEGGAVRGYAYASRWKARCAYRYCAETTVYLERDATGRGLGPALYAALLERLRERQLHAAIGVVALPNPASVALHERLGFRKAAHFTEVGFKFGRWIDVGYWQLML